jgi:alanyl-tRNA synthetase
MDLGDIILFEDEHRELVGLDTAFSLERIVAAAGDRHFETEVGEAPLIAGYLGERLAPCTEIYSSEVLLGTAEYIRALAVVLTEGLAPGNRGASYVVRKLLRHVLTTTWTWSATDLLGDGLEYAAQLMDGRVAHKKVDLVAGAGRALFADEMESFRLCVARARSVLPGIYDFELGCFIAPPEQVERVCSTYGITPGVISILSQERATGSIAQ